MTIPPDELLALLRDPEVIQKTWVRHETSRQAHIDQVTFGFWLGLTWPAFVRIHYFDGGWDRLRVADFGAQFGLARTEAPAGTVSIEAARAERAAKMAMGGRAP